MPRLVKSIEVVIKCDLFDNLDESLIKRKKMVLQITWWISSLEEGFDNIFFNGPINSEKNSLLTDRS